jgi:hypothetical protein
MKGLKLSPNHGFMQKRPSQYQSKLENYNLQKKQDLAKALSKQQLDQIYEDHNQYINTIKRKMIIPKQLDQEVKEHTQPKSDESGTPKYLIITTKPP